MLIFLIVGLLTQNADTSEPQNKELLKALKILESVINKDVTDVITVKPIPKNDILNFIHNLNPNLLIRPAVNNNYDNASPLLESRETTDKNTNNNDDEEQRRFSIWIQNVFSDKIRDDHKVKGKVSLENEIMEHDNSASINEGDEMPESRRLMNWFRYIFQTPNRLDRKKNINLNITDIKQKSQENITLNRTENNLTEVLDRLNHILTKINENLEEHNSISNSNLGFFVLKLPRDLVTGTQESDTKPISRRKRELNSTIEAVVVKNDNITEANYDKNVNISNTRRSFEPNSGLKMYEPRNLAGTENINAYDKSVDTARELKGNLIRIVADAFKDIKQKIGPIKTIKNKYLSDNMYIVGYIVACIDTLEVTLTKLMGEMESKKQYYNEKQLIELFNKLNTSNKVIDRLMESLHKYTVRQNSNYVI